MGKEQADFYTKIRALALESSAEANPLASTHEKQVDHTREKAGTQQPEQSDRVMPAEDRSSVFDPPTSQEIHEEIEQLFEHYPQTVRTDLEELFKQIFYSRANKHLSVEEDEKEDKEVAKQELLDSPGQTRLKVQTSESAEPVEESTGTKKFDLKASVEATIDDPPKKLPNNYDPKPSPLLKGLAADLILPFYEAGYEQLRQEVEVYAEKVERRRRQARESAARKRAENPEKYRAQNKKDAANYRKRKRGSQSQ